MARFVRYHAFIWRERKNKPSSALRILAGYKTSYAVIVSCT